MEEEVLSLPFDDNNNSERGRRGRLKEDAFVVVVVFIAANIAVDDIFFIIYDVLDF